MEEMITNEQQLIDLINNTYINPIIEKNKFDEIVVKKDNKIQCEFCFRYFDKNNYLNSVADKFINHNCLSMHFQYTNGNYYGGGYMDTCDNKDLSNEIIEMIDKHIKLDKKRYEQLTLW